MSVIIEDQNGDSWLPAYTGFNKIMGKNALVIPFRFIFVDGEWYEIDKLDPRREAYPIRSVKLEEVYTNPPELDPEIATELEEAGVDV